MRSLRPPRRGIVYLLVLGTASIIAVLTLGGLLVLRSQRKSSASETDATEARLYAQSGLEIGMQIITSDSNWRTNYTSGTWRTNQPIGSGTYSLDGVDPTDGNLANSSNDSLVLTATGVKGLATQKLQVTVFAKAKGLSCLQVDMVAGGTITFNGTNVAGGTVSSNAGISASSSAVGANVEAVGSITGSTYQQTVTTPITARALPQSSVFNYYVANGTAISMASMPLSGSSRLIDRKLISPNSNPFGATKNPKGIYIIDCGGSPVTIRDSRIVGTLVLLNCPATTWIDGSINWEPAITNYPALLVQGSAIIGTDHNSLSESSGSNFNFNPSGTPYNGTADSDTSDNYPSIIKGIVYVSQNLTLVDQATFEGVVVVGGAITSAQELDLTYNATYYNDAPPGFAAQTQVYISPGTFQRMVN